jgi:hypothetical protein
MWNAGDVECKTVECKAHGPVLHGTTAATCGRLGVARELPGVPKGLVLHSEQVAVHQCLLNFAVVLLPACVASCSELHYCWYQWR